MKERIQKIVAKAGIISRRKAEELIAQGRITVNGVVVKKFGTLADPEKDQILIDGKPIKGFEPKLYFLFYKPKGCLTTLKDPLGRPTVMDFLKKLKWRLFPVGRLDYDTSGALLITNDGELAYRLMHPKYLIPKTYLVKVKGIPSFTEIERLKKGLKSNKGYSMKAQVKISKKLKKNSYLMITLREGQNRQIKRMCLAVGHPVIKMERIRFAFLEIKDLKPGKYRSLEKSEVDRLKEMVGLTD
ncbi:MAG: pseudouridine synthase [Deltaproteobacteria bacterium]|nr:rRNA pseudouridine synthase [Deltaproteobacteria bacterium]RLA88882.1 MAG: pseudouridine synthase [Deltaproteobacteria bacterium]